MKEYVEKIAVYTLNSFTDPTKKIDLQFNLEDTSLKMSNSIPLGLLVNEILINAFKHAFSGREAGCIFLESKIKGTEVNLTVRDDGVGLPKDINEDKPVSLGMTLIRKFSAQLKGDLSVYSNKEDGTAYMLTFRV